METGKYYKSVPSHEDWSFTFCQNTNFLVKNPSHNAVFWVHRGCGLLLSLTALLYVPLTKIEMELGSGTPSVTYVLQCTGIRVEVPSLSLLGRSFMSGEVLLQVPLFLPITHPS